MHEPEPAGNCTPSQLRRGTSKGHFQLHRAALLNMGDGLTPAWTAQRPTRGLGPLCKRLARGVVLRVHPRQSSKGCDHYAHRYG